MERYALIVEHEACWGCRSCELACKQEHDFAVKFIHVIEEGPHLVGDRPDFLYRVKVCLHCDDPPCAGACPEEAISQRPDGIVVLDGDQCVGCQDCLGACPYGAIDFDDGTQKALKCNLCYHRVDQGLYPACADNVCLAHGIYFGDPEAIHAAIARKREKRADRSSSRFP